MCATIMSGDGKLERQTWGGGRCVLGEKVNDGKQQVV